MTFHSNILDEGEFGKKITDINIISAKKGNFFVTVRQAKMTNH